MTLFGIEINLYFPLSTKCSIFSEGVAEARIIGIFLSCAILIATSLAENFKPFCCLKDASCSSSIIIKESFWSGTKSEDRVPIKTLSSPDLDFFHVSNLSLEVFFECYVPMFCPNLFLNLCSN